MIPNRVLCLGLAMLLSGCLEPYQKSDARARQPLKHAGEDTAFLAFIGRLRVAVNRKDLPMLASMMAGDFGYTWDESAPPGAAVFTYWDQNNLWPVLGDLLREKFIPQDLYLVSPPLLTVEPRYAGPRIGMRVVSGSWKFAYFLPHGPPS